eukprot:scaffold28544_cov78-Attheya_sp.AAC.6
MAESAATNAQGETTNKQDLKRDAPWMNAFVIAINPHSDSGTDSIHCVLVWSHWRMLDNNTAYIVMQQQRLLLIVNLEN